MGKQQIFYKLVNPNLMSCIAKKQAIQYKVGEWVAPIIPNSKLFVFGSFEMAVNFHGVGNNAFRIFECEVGNPIVQKYIWWYSDEHQYEKFWQGCFEHNIPAPTGSFGADKVKLVKEVNG